MKLSNIKKWIKQLFCKHAYIVKSLYPRDWEDVDPPIYRAKALHKKPHAVHGYAEGWTSDEYVIGWYFHTVAYDTHKIAPLGEDYREVQIDPSTLVVSFNNGATWRTIEEVRNGLSFLDEPTIKEDMRQEMKEDNK